MPGDPPGPPPPPSPPGLSLIASGECLGNINDCIPGQSESRRRNYSSGESLANPAMMMTINDDSDKKKEEEQKEKEDNSNTGLTGDPSQMHSESELVSGVTAQPVDGG